MALEQKTQPGPIDFAWNDGRVTPSQQQPPNGTTGPAQPAPQPPPQQPPPQPAAAPPAAPQVAPQAATGPIPVETLCPVCGSKQHVTGYGRICTKGHNSSHGVTPAEWAAQQRATQTAVAELQQPPTAAPQPPAEPAAAPPQASQTPPTPTTHTTPPAQAAEIPAPEPVRQADPGTLFPGLAPRAPQEAVDAGFDATSTAKPGQRIPALPEPTPAEAPPPQMPSAVAQAPAASAPAPTAASPMMQLPGAGLELEVPPEGLGATAKDVTVSVQLRGPVARLMGILLELEEKGFLA